MGRDHNSITYDNLEFEGTQVSMEGCADPQRHISAFSRKEILTHAAVWINLTTLC